MFIAGFKVQSWEKCHSDDISKKFHVYKKDTNLVWLLWYFDNFQISNCSVYDVK